MPKKITEITFASNVTPEDNPNFYIEVGGVFRRVTLGQMIDCIKDDIDVGGELTEAAKQAFLDCFEHVAWVDDQGQTYYDALHDALYPTPTSITAVFTQGGATIYDTQTLNDLRQYLVVTAVFNDGTEKEVSSYTLSGTLTAGTSTITVTYQGLTTRFNVVVTHNAARLTAVYTQSGTVYETDSLDSLKSDLVVTYYATQQSQGVVLSDNDYTLSGTLTEGTSTITAVYDTVSASFTVTVTADPAYIEAVFTQPQTTIYTDDTLDSLKDYLVVTYYSAPGATGTVLADSAYTLSGTLTAGTSVITASYQGLTDTFNVINVVPGYWDTWEYQYTGALKRAVGNSHYDSASGNLQTSGTEVPNRVYFYSDTGEKGIWDNSVGSWTSHYPTPIPDDAVAVTLTCDTTFWASIIVYTYDSSTGRYTMLQDLGSQGYGGGHQSSLPAGTHRLFMCVGGIRESADVPDSVPSFLNITFV